MPIGLDFRSRMRLYFGVDRRFRASQNFLAGVVLCNRSEWGHEKCAGVRNTRFGCGWPLTVGGAQGARLVVEHARVAALVAAVVDQLPLLALVERHVAAGAGSSGRLALQQLTDGREICRPKNKKLCVRISKMRYKINSMKLFANVLRRREN